MSYHSPHRSLRRLAFPYLDFFQMVHSMAAYYQPNMSKPFQCMFSSVIEMIPSTDNFKRLLTEALILYPLSFDVLYSSANLIQWTYTINMYVHRQLYGTNYTPYQEFIAKYTPVNMTIKTWSHPTWKMIHYYGANYDGSSEYALSYKAFVSCLQFILPCSKCREHLKDNLANHPIDQFFSSPSDLFTWGYILHQTVSSQLKKKGISIQEARRLYGMEN